MVSSKKLEVSVIGIGAMGGGIARALLKSSDIESVVGYDVSDELMKAFYDEAKAVSKQGHLSSIPKSLEEALEISDTVLLVLVNEAQCQQVCSSILTSSSPSLSTIVLCSTVRATWVRETASLFQKKGIAFVDCPISGGPVRALAGDLSIMASCDDEVVLTSLHPLWRAMAGDKDSNIHMIPGGSGMGSTAKMVHQLLAGVHIAIGAEALTLAAKAGLNPKQMYDIVNGAAGQSWMFTDRGSRMLQADTDQVKSALNIFIKDLDIVYSESKAFQSPIPIASAALQQFICGQSLGLGKKDDSQVIQVYEKLANVSVSGKVAHFENNDEEIKEPIDAWTFPNGETEEIVDVGDEARHFVVISNEYTRVMKISFPPGDTTTAHRHVEDSLYFFLVPGGNNVINHIQGSDPCCDCMQFGEVRYGSHLTDGKPLVHKITNTNMTEDMCGLDAELLKRPPVTSPIPMVAEFHTLIKTRNKCRVYHLVLPPGETVTINYAFFYLTVVVAGGSAIEKSIPSGNQQKMLSYMESYEKGHVEWNQPTFGIKLTNKGDVAFEQYIAEWC